MTRGIESCQVGCGSVIRALTIATVFDQEVCDLTTRDDLTLGELVSPTRGVEEAEVRHALETDVKILVVTRAGMTHLLVDSLATAIGAEVKLDANDILTEVVHADVGVDKIDSDVEARSLITACADRGRNGVPKKG